MWVGPTCVTVHVVVLFLWFRPPSSPFSSFCFLAFHAVAPLRFFNSQKVKAHMLANEISPRRIKLQLNHLLYTLDLWNTNHSIAIGGTKTNDGVCEISGGVTKALKRQHNPPTWTPLGPYIPTPTSAVRSKSDAPLSTLNIHTPPSPLTTISKFIDELKQGQISAAGKRLRL